VDHYRLGDPLQPVSASTIAHAWRLDRIAAGLTAALAVAALLAPSLLRGVLHVA
jgi:hypothetical protein